MPRTTQEKTEKSLGERLRDGSISDIGKRKFTVTMSLNEWAVTVLAIEGHPEHVAKHKGQTRRQRLRLRGALREILGHIAGGRQA